MNWCVSQTIEKSALCQQTRWPIGSPQSPCGCIPTSHIPPLTHRLLPAFSILELERQLAIEPNVISHRESSELGAVNRENTPEKLSSPVDCRPRASASKPMPPEFWHLASGRQLVSLRYPLMFRASRACCATGHPIAVLLQGQYNPDSCLAWCVIWMGRERCLVFTRCCQ